MKKFKKHQLLAFLFVLVMAVSVLTHYTSKADTEGTVQQTTEASVQSSDEAEKEVDATTEAKTEAKTEEKTEAKTETEKTEAKTEEEKTEAEKTTEASSDDKDDDSDAADKTEKATEASTEKTSPAKKSKAKAAKNTEADEATTEADEAENGVAPQSDEGDAQTGGTYAVTTADNLTISILDKDGKAFSTDNPIKKGDSITIRAKFSIFKAAVGKDLLTIDLNTMTNITNPLGGLCISSKSTNVGTFSVQDGVIKMAYDWTELKNTYPNQNEYESTVDMEATASFGEDAIGDDGKVHFTIQGVDYAVPYVKADSTVTLTKTTGDLVADETGVYQKFTINAVADGDTKSLKLTDTLASSSLSFVTSGDRAPVLTVGGTTKNVDFKADGTTAEIGVGDLAKGETATLTCWVKVDGAAYENIYDGTKKNQVTGTFTDDKGNSQTSNTATAGFNLTKPNVWKSASNVQDTEDGKKTITWTVGITGGDVNIGYVYKDTETQSGDTEKATFTPATTVSVKRGNTELSSISYEQLKNGLTIADADDLENGKVKLEKGEQLTLTYTSTYDVSDVNPTVGYTAKNQIIGTKEGFPNIDSGAVSKDVVGKEGITTTKSCDGYDVKTGKITWKATVTVPENATDVKFYDTIGKGQKLDEDSLTVNGAKASFTKEEYTATDEWTGKYSVVLSGGTASNGKITYTLSYTTEPSATGTLKNKAYTEATYGGTTIDSKGTDGKESESSYYYDNAILTKKEGYGTGDTTGKQLWKVTINLSALDLSGDKTIKIKDTLPEGLELVEGSFKLGNDSVEIKPEVNGQVFMTGDLLSLLKEYKSKNTWATTVELSYETRFSELTKTIENKQYTNKAAAIYDGKEQPEISGTGWAKYDGESANKNGDIIDKNVSYDEKAPTVLTYTVTVNKYGLKLLTDGATKLQVTDTIGSALTYTGAVSVVDTTDNTDITKTKCSVTTSENKMTIEIPDETPLKITYTCYINLSVGTDTEKYTEEQLKTVTNSVQLEGVGDWIDGDKSEWKGVVQDASSTTHPLQASLTIKKVDEEGNALSGAKFKIYLVTYDEKTGFTEAKAGSPSDYNGSQEAEAENGEVTFSNLLYDYYYCYEEIEAPSGYKQDTTKHYVLFEGGEPPSSVPSEVNRIYNYIGTYSDTIANEKDDTKYYDVEISKIDAANSKEIAGAKLTIAKGTDGKGDSVASWTSGDDGTNEDGTVKTHTVRLAAGDYTLTETTAPDGYETAKSITFIVTNEGKVQINGEDADKVVMKDEVAKHEVEISKTEINGTEELAGASLKITDADGKQVETWTSTTESHKVKLEAGTYTLIEETAPDGYDKTETITFTVDKDGKVTVDGKEVDKVIMKDAKQGNLVIKKTIEGSVTKDEAEGTLTFTVTDTLTNTPTEYKLSDFDYDETTKTWTKTLPEVKGGYTVTETATDVEGYTLTSTTYIVGDAESQDGKSATADVKSGEDTKVAFKNTYTKDEATKYEVEISKVDATSKEELAGAKLTITKKNAEGKAETVEEWTSTSETHKVKLAAGEYTLTETTAPEGYEKAESITFIVTEDGKVTVKGEEQTGNKITMEDTAKKAEETETEVEISKVDATSKEELAGAKLTITKKNAEGKAETVEEWTSTSETHKVKLAAGEYTLTETTAPEGYEKAESITFIVTEDGKVTVKGEEQTGNKITMEDTAKKAEETKTHDVEISKVDITGDEIEGAALTVTDKDGETVASWKSGEDGKDDNDKIKPHTLKLEAGTYTLTEATAPDGYKKAEDITFTVDENGKVTVDGEEVSKVTMTDEYADKKVVISKTDINGTNEIAGAQLTVTDKDGKEVESWTSEAGKSHEINVQPGTYTLTETTAPEGYKKAESITFTVDKDGKVTVDGKEVDKVVMKDDYDDKKEEVKTHNVEISKVDIAGEEIEGAALTVTDKDGETVASWKSGDDGKDDNDKIKPHTLKLEAGTYTLTETTAPKGYEKAENITFTVDENGKVTVDGKEVSKVTMTDKYADQKVVISKTDINGTNEIAGAELTVTDKDGKEVESWTSEANKSHEITVQPGTYTLTETTAPEGYKKAESITFTVDKDGKVTVDGKEVEKVVMKDDYADKKEDVKTYEVEISKVDIAGEEIEGAALTVTDKDGETVASWKSGEDGKDDNDKIKPHTLKLEAGTYTLTETTAPKGYEKAEAVTFTVDENGKVTVDGEEVSKITMTDKYSDQKVVISKTDINGTNEIAGAELTVTDKDGKEVESWTSEADKSHEINVQPGTYTLTETTAPEGYKKAESITFTVDKDGKVTVDGKEVEKVTMKDDYDDKKEDVKTYEVEISKVDIAGEEIEGAELTVTDKDGKTVASWKSGEDGKDDSGKVKTHTLKLEAGIYTLTETTAPKGYEKAENITFTVDENGKVTVDGKEVSKVTMTDKYADQKVVISKTDINGTNEIAGAELTVTDKDGKEVDSWTSEAEKSHEITVQPGTYTLTETTAPEGYKKAESITFTVDKDGKVTVDGKEVEKVVMKDDYADKKEDVKTYEVEISKVDIAGEEIEGAALTVTDKDGKTVASWKSGDDGKDDSGKVKTHTLKLEAGTYTLTETTAPDGYKKAENITFTVDENGKVTVDDKEVSKVTMTDEYADKKDATTEDKEETTTEETDEADDTTTEADDDDSEEDTTEASGTGTTKGGSNGSSGSSSGGSSSSRTSRSSKTGDNTPIGWLVLICAACLIVITFATMKIKAAGGKHSRR